MSDSPDSVPGAPGDVTQLLLQWHDGDPNALSALMERVHGELRRMAGARMAKERHAGTLNATALVNEAYVKLVDAKRIEWADRRHFFAVAARAMRQIVVDHARRLRAEKRGGGVTLVGGDALERVGEVGGGFDLIDLEAALAELETLDPRQARIVELKFFSGLSIEECSKVLALSEATIKREWRSARAWLFSRLSPSATSERT